VQPSGAGPSDNVRGGGASRQLSGIRVGTSIASEIADRFAPDSVLDVGCGRGYLVQALKSQGLDARGIDKSEQAIGDAPDSDCSVGDIALKNYRWSGRCRSSLLPRPDARTSRKNSTLRLRICARSRTVSSSSTSQTGATLLTPDLCNGAWQSSGYLDSVLEMAHGQLRTPWHLAGPIVARPRRRTCDVSAIIPVFNGRRFLLQAVNSVLNQTLPVRSSFSLTRIIGAQFDCLDGLDATVNIITHVQPNSGQSVARNAGAKLASVTSWPFLIRTIFVSNHVEILRSYFAQEGGDRLDGCTAT